MEYPKREPYFAHRFVRVLHKSCASQDIGRDACWLLTIIAHTEDAARYTGPVRFWNGQLMETLAYESRKQFIKVRQRAIDAGWLNYERSGNKAVGQYWVTIPSRFSGLSDAPLGEGVCVPPGNNNDCQNNPIVSSRKRKGDRSGNIKGTDQETYSIPSPVPGPVPEDERANSAKPESANELQDAPTKVPGNEYLEALLDGWGTLCGVPQVRDRTGAELLKAWRNGWKKPSVREWMKQPEQVIDMIRHCSFLRGKSWFSFAWLFKREHNGTEENMTKLMRGQYRDRVEPSGFHKTFAQQKLDNTIAAGRRFIEGAKQ